MTKKIYLIIAASALLSTPSIAQTWVNDTVQTGTGYTTNVYYSLENGIAGTAPSDNWHLGLSVGKFSESIITNSADKGVKIYQISNDSTDFGTNLTTALGTAISTNPISFYNSNQTWIKGALNYGSATYGWAEYDPNTHWLNGTVVFGFISGTDTLQLFVKEKQTTPSNNAPVYIIKTAKIDGSNPQTYTLNISSSAGRNYTYLNLLNGVTVEREPLASNWDFVFTNYNDSSVVMQNTQYKVFGILNNNNVMVAQVDTPSSQYDNVNYNTVNNYDSSIVALGRGWKVSGMNGSVAKDSVTYFLKLKNGNIWQMVFTDFKSGMDTVAPGLAAFKKRLVFDATTSIQTNQNETASCVLVPNPATNNANILIDAKVNLGAVQINVLDINGRIVKQWDTNITSGFYQIPLNVSSFNNGIYLINIQGKGFQKTLKMVKH
ncbi:MAG TPA: T9SS type A sorting domain-containing protein [Edaphocola sp.]|nr:T9SS type A sorting domain-containing protein [Edaphocola sp.]